MTRRRHPFQIAWNPEHKPDTGTPLEKLTLPRGNWEFGSVYRDTLVARKWGLHDPEEFWKKSKRLQAIMIASVEAEMEMEAWEEKVAESKRK